MSQILPPSFYLLGKPAWWGSSAFPAIGPDVKAGAGPGSHNLGIPAQNCYLKTMGGVGPGGREVLSCSTPAIATRSISSRSIRRVPPYSTARVLRAWR